MPSANRQIQPNVVVKIEPRDEETEEVSSRQGSVARLVEQPPQGEYQLRKPTSKRRRESWSIQNALQDVLVNYNEEMHEKDDKIAELEKIIEEDAIANKIRIDGANRAIVYLQDQLKNVNIALEEKEAEMSAKLAAQQEANILKDKKIAELEALLRQSSAQVQKLQSDLDTEKEGTKRKIEKIRKEDDKIAREKYAKLQTHYREKFSRKEKEWKRSREDEQKENDAQPTDPRRSGDRQESLWSSGRTPNGHNNSSWTPYFELP